MNPGSKQQHIEKDPLDLDTVRDKARKAISPIKPADSSTRADKSFLFDAKRTDAGRKLPPYYLVYFLLVELLGFKNLGQFEKLAWSVPIDFHGEAFLIEHRKFGVGVFAKDLATQEAAAAEIVKLIHKGVKAAKPFFGFLANEAMQKSRLNVTNNSPKLFGRLMFFLNEYKNVERSEKSKDSSAIIEQAKKTEDVAAVLNWLNSTGESNNWLALAAIDAFFSWTEHVFIHLAILTGKVTAGKEIANLAMAEWSDKYKTALSLDDRDNQRFYESLLALRKQVRNFIAHGAFGKEGEAFSFHSGAGAVPITLEEKKNSYSFALAGELAFKNEEAIRLIEEFIEHFWSGERKPARIYLHEHGLPVILTMAEDNTYAKAMMSTKEMESLADHLSRMMDNSANMDW